MIGIFSLIIVTLVMLILYLFQQMQELTEQLQDRVEHPENYINEWIKISK